MADEFTPDLDAPPTIEELHALIVRDHPAVAPLVDLLVGESYEQMEALAVDIETRLANVAPAEPSGSDKAEFVRKAYGQAEQFGPDVVRVPAGTSLAPEPAEVVRGVITAADLKDARGMPASTDAKWDAFWRSTEASDQGLPQ